MPSPTDTAGHTKAFDYPVMDDPLGGGRSVPRVTTHRFTVDHANPLSQPAPPSKERDI